MTLVIKKEVTFAWHGANVSRMHICNHSQLNLIYFL